MNQPEWPPLLAWPGWTHLRFTWLLTLAVTALFTVVYGGANWLTAHRTFRVRVHLDSELNLPMIPEFTLVYMSIYALFLATPFVLRTRGEIKHLARAQSLTILIAGISFLLFPAQLAYAPATEAQLGAWRKLFEFASRLSLEYNLAPSLHVALSIVCIELFARHATSGEKLLLRAWGIGIAMATLFIHRHHMLDVATGYLLAFCVVAFSRPHDH
ncbi:MAG TPA: hypothetical protein VFB72_09985 [Verrucomicrobiae bacterium]|nr:hypothetical protein [Verrucomicrobiae bacterium]